MNEEAKTRLRCRPGDMARVVQSSNGALVGRIVEVGRLHGDGRWECVLVGDAVMGMADDGLGLLLTRDWLFPDGCLEPRASRGKNYLAAFPKSLAA